MSVSTKVTLVPISLNFLIGGKSTTTAAVEKSENVDGAEGREGGRRKRLRKSRCGFCVSLEIASRLFTPLFVRRSVCGLSL